ncbi:hypothetical protein FRX31_009970 [Thalictrum thalictroides]|uniref:Bifunctional inhibitor/plant lipid transfer protein/seed storage helical domain-containing protein n=1 Tax=Thalictrum thalictroides TaxID=46969 RepID=A0A7J6WWL1_THATH|nr:hypothetical protein FRX31_009970 [Thalictrum thalictroides]
MKGVMIIGLLVMLSMVLMVKPIEAITCPGVGPMVRSCMNYLVGITDNLSRICCGRMWKIKTMMVTTDDKRQMCNCLKRTASGQKIKEAAIAALPARCGLLLPFTISKNMNCDM